MVQCEREMRSTFPHLMNRLIIHALALIAVTSVVQAQTPDLELSATEKGIAIKGEVGSFLFVPAMLRLTEKDYEGQKPILELAGDNELTAKFPSGAEITLRVSPEDKTIEGSISGVPAGAWGVIFQMQIPISFSLGGKFSLGSAPLQDFPADYSKQLLDQKTAKQFDLVNPAGGGMTLVATQNFMQVQDNRAFQWPIFMYIYTVVFSSNPGSPSFRIHFEPLETAASAR